MKKFILALAAFLSIYSTVAQAIEPVTAGVGKLNFSVDPRIELLGAVQTTADYTYGAYPHPAAKEYFGDQVGSKAVVMTKKLAKAGFVYDAPPHFMLHLSQPYGLEQRTEYSDELKSRAHGKRHLNKYRKYLKQFALESDFEEFWNSNRETYERSVEYTVGDLDGFDVVKSIEDYYNESQNSYNIILTSFMGNYGPRLPAAGGKMDIYSITYTREIRDGIPFISKDNLISMSWHEFSHSFVNPSTDRHVEQVRSYERLFAPIKDVMKSRAYGNWITTVNEHIVRAVELRLSELYLGKEAADRAKRTQLRMGFVYLEPILEKLKEFEKKRDAEGIAFSEYYPELLTAFDGLEPTGHLMTINSMVDTPKVAFVYPTQGGDDRVKKYVGSIYEMVRGRKENASGWISISDSTALVTPLEGYHIFCYGTPKSNLLLRKYERELPFRVSADTLYADKPYTQEGVKLICTMPNPYDNTKTMAVYTALDDKYVVGINSVSHGLDDFLIFLDRQNILSRGDYVMKNGRLQFP